MDFVTVVKNVWGAISGLGASLLLPLIITILGFDLRPETSHSTARRPNPRRGLYCP